MADTVAQSQEISTIGASIGDAIRTETAQESAQKSVQKRRLTGVNTQ